MASLEDYEFTHDNGSRKTFYLAAGPRSGPLLIFIHGWPAIAKTWRNQLVTFASLGFRVVAPDMPGYGRSTANKEIEDYAQERINQGMLALLEHLGRERAVWIGHDWGCGSVWTFAAHYPENCVAVAGLTVPYAVLELGLEEVLKYVDRDIYPEETYPYGQWSYQNFYEQDFEKATAFFEKDVPAVLKALYRKGLPESYGKVAGTANVTKDGGWFGGGEKPNPKFRDIPLSDTVLDEETFNELVAAMEKTGFRGADAWYMNHTPNRTYTLEKRKNDGYLNMPVLFIHARWDGVCATVLSTMCEPMRKLCPDLTETVIDSGHWVAEEKPEETNAAIARWLAESVKEYWPGYWTNAHAKSML